MKLTEAFDEYDMVRVEKVLYIKGDSGTIDSFYKGVTAKNIDPDVDQALIDERGLEMKGYKKDT